MEMEKTNLLHRRLYILFVQAMEEAYSFLKGTKHEEFHVGKVGCFLGRDTLNVVPF